MAGKGEARVLYVSDSVYHYSKSFLVNASMHVFLILPGGVLYVVVSVCCALYLLDPWLDTGRSRCWHQTHV